MSEFEDLVLRMREAQKRYFKTKCGSALKDSKILERSVDLILARYEKPQIVVDNQTDMFENRD